MSDTWNPCIHTAKAPDFLSTPITFAGRFGRLYFQLRTYSGALDPMLDGSVWVPESVFAVRYRTTMSLAGVEPARLI